MSFDAATEQRIDWWRITEDLRAQGVSIDQQAQLCRVGKATLLGWRNLDAEPKHIDGERLLALWRSKVQPAVPMVSGRSRYRAAR